MIKSISSKSGFTVVFEDGPLMIHRSSPSYEEAALALKNSDYARLRQLLDPIGSIKQYTQNSISVSENGELVYGGRRMGSFCRDLIEKCARTKTDWSVVQHFFNSWSKNPSLKALDELDSVMSSMDFPITYDGGILAYKVVLPTYVDPDTGLHVCTVGKTVSVPRDAVSRFARAGSERGFVAGALDFIGSNTLVGKNILVKIMPEDIIGVFLKPCRQILTCKFTVMAEQTDIFKFAIYDADLQPVFLKN